MKKLELFNTICKSEENSDLLFSKANAKFSEIAEITRKEMGDEFHLNAVSCFENAKSSLLYKLIFRMPKGALTHHHIPIHGLPEHTANIAIKENNFFADINNEIVIPSNDNISLTQGFVKLSEVKPFERIKHLFLLDTKILKVEDVWRNFDKKYCNVKTVISNTKYFKDYMRKLFYDCLEEGILIYQGRHFFGHVVIFEEHFSSKINYLDPIEEIKIIFEVLEEVRKKEPLFEVNLIYSFLRYSKLEFIRKELDKFVNLKNLSPEIDNLIIGFDLVGDESLKESKYFFKLLYEYREKIIKDNLMPNSKLEYYLHSGESMSENNTNIIDSINLNCLRIGHGINLIKHPDLINKIKANEICLEICPLSNQILKYVNDLREHPLIYFYECGIKMTLNSDDDGIFGTGSLLTYDMFICVVSMKMDFNFLYECILNSFKFSGIKVEKLKLIQMEWKIRWDDFIRDLANM